MPKAKKSKASRKFAPTRDAQTFDRHVSQASETAVLKAAPLDVAKDEAQTLSVSTFETEGGGTINAYPKRREVNGTELVETVCPNGHKEGKGEVTAGTLGKTATCSNCGELLVATVYLDAKDGTPLTITRQKAKAGKKGGEEGATDKIIAKRNESQRPKAEEGTVGEESASHADRRAGRTARRKAKVAKSKRSSGAAKPTVKEAAEV